MPKLDYYGGAPKATLGQTVAKQILKLPPEVKPTFVPQPTAQPMVPTPAAATPGQQRVADAMRRLFSPIGQTFNEYAANDARRLAQASNQWNAFWQNARSAWNAFQALWPGGENWDIWGNQGLPGPGG